MSTLKDIARRVLTINLAVKPGENFIVITDTVKEPIGRALFEAGLELGVESQIFIMKPRSRNAEEPPKPIAEAWKYADVFIAPTRYSLTHTQARKKATEAGARGATMPGITEDIFIRTLSIDYRGTVLKLGTKMLNKLKNSREVRVRTESGTDIKFEVKGREFHLDSGIYDRPGSFGNLPAGEVYVAPVEGTGEGVVVVDGSISGGIGIVKTPVTIEVHEGYVTSIKGGEEARRLKEVLESVGKKEAFNFPAELGIGCNPAAKIVGVVLEDEKVYGTIHLAIGDNSTIGGNVIAGIHIDCVLMKPTLIVDGETIIDRGEWKI